MTVAKNTSFAKYVTKFARYNWSTGKRVCCLSWKYLLKECYFLKKWIISIFHNILEYILCHCATSHYGCNIIAIIDMQRSRQRVRWTLPKRKTMKKLSTAPNMDWITMCQYLKNSPHSQRHVRQFACCRYMKFSLYVCFIYMDAIIQ